MTGSGLTPALVVVDSRNIFHQTESATGFRLRPTVDGVVNAMADYGFDALEVHVGLAMPRSQDVAHLPNAATENGAYMDEIEASDRGSVLLGELHRKQKANGKYAVEEKQVDVACAVDICRHATLMAHHDSPFKTIIVLSQDTDLTPAFKYAGEVGAPLVIAAYERVERRGFSYMLLTERAFRSMARVHVRAAGHALRAAVAQAVMAADRWDDWTVVGRDPSRERISVERADGLRGVVREDHIPGSSPGASVKLRVAGVDFGRRRTDFPLVTCSAKKPHPVNHHRKAFETRFARGRRGLAEVKLDRPVLGKERLEYPPGGIATGTELLVDCTEADRPLIVGPLNAHDSRGLMQAEPFCVVPVKHHSATATFARTEKQGRVLLSHSAAVRPTIGARYAAVLVEAGGNAVAKLISSELP